ncbi:cupin domain-containing protein [Crocosphaera sp. XPORK-15E]|uniref:cupin domain-containing protein n=1 Tax=Crocosphaera sp. XPORK-15E TaxID=3110247 RepID=UPI002B1FB731|nr:cupin domain-containing protein [Crocosphaera sp. XPORK-15E]MEA5536729.1 cupin domain-containing protein [Crocosphaera sp. XPORK-15E]
MSQFFPEQKIINVNEQVELLAFQCEDTVIQLASIAPGATFPLHQHQESQIGMIFNGSLEMDINGNKTIIQPLDHVYIAGSNIPHGSKNLLSQTILGFDVKRIIPTSLSTENQSQILRVLPNKTKNLGRSCRSVKGAWFEIIITEIPPKKNIPKKQSSLPIMGITLNSKLEVQIETEKQQVAYGNIYYTPAKTACEVSNLTDDTVSLLEIILEEL